MRDIDTVTQLLTVEQAPGEYTPLIRSPEEYHRLSRAYLALQDLYNGSPDAPSNDQEFSTCVMRVAEAIVDVHGDRDAYNQAGHAKTATKFILSLPAFVVQLTAYKIVTTLSSVHQGIYNMPSWDTLKVKATIKLEHYETFEARLQAVLDVLTQSKAVCKNLFDCQTTWLHRVTMSPTTQLKLNKNNVKGNAERQERYGKVQQEERDGVRARPAKRPRTSFSSGLSPDHDRAAPSGIGSFTYLSSQDQSSEAPRFYHRHQIQSSNGYSTNSLVNTHRHEPLLRLTDSAVRAQISTSGDDDYLNQSYYAGGAQAGQNQSFDSRGTSYQDNDNKFGPQVSQTASLHHDNVYCFGKNDNPDQSPYDLGNSIADELPIIQGAAHGGFSTPDNSLGGNDLGMFGECSGGLGVRSGVPINSFNAQPEPYPACFRSNQSRTQFDQMRGSCFLQSNDQFLAQTRQVGYGHQFDDTHNAHSMHSPGLFIGQIHDFSQLDRDEQASVDDAISVPTDAVHRWV